LKTKLLHLWDVLTSTYWFVPGVMLVTAAALAMGVLWVDARWTRWAGSAWVYTGGPEGARALLSAVAGSVVTVAGVVFSISISTLTQASSQFGPRLLRNFMRDTGNQVVLGTFVSTFVYCLLVLRAVRGQEGHAFVPNVAVTGAVLLAVGSTVVLIYYIHHVARSLQAPVVVAAVGAELERAIDRMFPGGIGEDDRADARGDEGAQPAHVCEVRSREAGYVQAVDQGGLMRLAEREDLILHLACRPGNFVIGGQLLARATAWRPVAPPVADEVRGLFIFGQERSAEQDLEFGFDQLVEIAVRALSPGINDPFTAINCVDRLGAALAAVSRRGLPSATRLDSRGRPRVVARVSTFDGLCDTAFHSIRQYGAGSVPVAVRLIEMLTALGGAVGSVAQRRALFRHATLVYEQATAAAAVTADREVLAGRYAAAERVLGGSERTGHAPERGGRT
jgi:uncharacterized membrane protein